MTATRRFAGLTLLTVAACAVGLLTPSTAYAQAPVVVAWWNQANVGNGTPPPPSPPDVAAKDLYIAGSNTGPAAPEPPAPGVPGNGSTPATAQALAGLTFEVPDGASIGTLTLPLDGTPPPQISVIACRATEIFVAAYNGAASDTPTYSCPPTPVTATLKGSDLVFANVSQLLQGSTLSIVLVPGPLDRIVLRPPTNTALTVTTQSAGIGAAAFGAPPGSSSGGSVSSAGTHAAEGPGPFGIGSIGNPPLNGTGNPALSPATGRDQAPPPDVAAPVGISRQAAAAASGSAGHGNSRNRRVAALGLVAAEIVGFLSLQRRRSGPPIAGGGRTPVTDGGRLRPPDVAGVAEAPAANRPRGVGRFTRVRPGPVPRL